MLSCWKSGIFLLGCSQISSQRQLGCDGSACDQYQLVTAFIHTPRLSADVEVPIYHAIVQCAQDIHEKPTRLEIIIITPGDDNIVNLQHHPAKLRCQHQLLLLANQRINDECITHIVASSLHAIDA